jgi:hypothetical protein
MVERSGGSRSRGPASLRPARRVAISERHLDAICKLVDESMRPMTWDEIVDEAEKEFGHRWTRQGLEKHDRIKAAYLARRDSPAKKQAIDPAVALLTDKVERQTQEIERLKQLVGSYKDLFIRYQANAHARRISPAELEAALPAIIKRGSDD